MRLILHPGFHKTGTSSLQAMLRANRARLAPWCRIVLEQELAEPLRHATRFASGGDPFDLAAFTAGFAGLCQTLAAEETPARALVISCEGLSGRTPGKNGIRDYGAAVPLAQAMQRAVRAVWGRRARPVFLYTTRAPGAWLSSAWRHNLWGYRITEDFATFSTQYAAAADLEAMVRALAAALPKAQVQGVALEAVQDCPAGPAEAILRLLDLPAPLRAGLENPGPRNRGWTEAEAQALLALNRSDLDDADVKAQKAALRRRG